MHSKSLLVISSKPIILRISYGKNWFDFKSRNPLKIALFEWNEFAILGIWDLEINNFWSLDIRVWWFIYTINFYDKTTLHRLIC